MTAAIEQTVNNQFAIQITIEVVGTLIASGVLYSMSRTRKWIRRELIDPLHKLEREVKKLKRKVKVNEIAAANERKAQTEHRESEHRDNALR